jgi:ketosteroid isomerase-like protein
MIDYATANDLLEAWAEAQRTFDGDDWVALFSDDAEYHVDPFGAPLVGHNALRAYLLESARTRKDVDITVERHWVSGATVLAAWHGTWVARDTGRVVRIAGFLTAEVANDGRISHYREWTQVAPDTAG